MSFVGFYEANLPLIQTTLVYMVLAASVQVALRAGVFSLASIGFWGLGAYTAGILATREEYGAVPALLAAVVLSGVVGFVLALAFVRLRGMYLAMATVAFDLVLAVIAVNGGEFTGGALGIPGVPPLLYTWHLAVIAILVAGLLAYSERGRLGRFTVAVAADEEVAASLGIDVRRTHRIAFTVSAMLGGLSGAMHALLFSFVSPDQFGFNLVVVALTMAVLGGAGSWIGAYAGSIVVLWLPELLRFIDDWRNAVYGALLILVVAKLPRGLVGAVSDVLSAGWTRRSRLPLVGSAAPRRGGEAA